MSTVYQSTMLALSRAGHDKGKLYVILKEEDGYCYLADGKIKGIDHPKKKKRMHLQIICHLPDELKQMMSMIEDDQTIRKILKQYQNER